MGVVDLIGSDEPLVKSLLLLERDCDVRHSLELVANEMRLSDCRVVKQPEKHVLVQGTTSLNVRINCTLELCIHLTNLY